MERGYNYIYLFFLVILLVLLWGFFRTYIVFFPSFDNFNYIHHLHGSLMMTWMVMLIVQPLLIRRKLLAAHRFVGKLSYVVMPLLLLSIFFVGKLSYYKVLEVAPREEAIGGVALNLPALLAFGVLYSLAIFNKKKTRIHMRYMIGTSLLMFGPGLGRALIEYFGVPLPAAVTYTHYVALAIALLLLMFDVFNKKPYLPFAITSLVLFIDMLPWQFRLSPVWQAVGSKFAAAFY